MVQFDTITRKWGNSIGVTFPKESVEKGKLAENQKVHVIVIPKDDTLMRTFGMAKGIFKKSAQEIKDELRKELYDD